MNIVILDAAIKVVCPIHGVSVGDPANKTTWRIDFKDEATPDQRKAGQAALDAFDPVLAEKNAALLAQLAVLDAASNTTRGLRELAILANQMNEQLRATTNPALHSFSANVGITKAQAIETQAAALRAQLK